ncbi:MAG: NAD-dependent epimerase/dehydratase family protein [Casimicrobiaceae bacterium]
MRVLITGGAGFIGSHLAERLLRDDHEVVALDNLSTGTLDNLAGVRDDPRFTCVIGSVRDAALVDELVQECDVTVHLAAAVGVRLILSRPSVSLHTNVNGTENVVHAASSRNKKVIIASTSEVYGKSRTMPFSESDDLVLGSTANLRWSYACAKALDECLALAYAQEGKLAAMVVRLFNTTGPRQTGHYGMVLPGFIAQALRGEPITVYGTGAQSRCFAHVADVVESIVRLMATPAAYGEIFNVGNDEEITIEDLALRVKAATGSASPVQKLPYSDVYGPGFEDMARRVPDVRKLERCIGYRPRTSLDRIIADIVAAQRAAVELH